MLFLQHKKLTQHFYAGLELNIHKYFFQRARARGFINILRFINYNGILFVELIIIVNERG